MLHGARFQHIGNRRGANLAKFLWNISRASLPSHRRRRVGPGLARVEDARIDARQRHGTCEAETGIGPHRLVLEITGKRRVEKRARDLDRHARPLPYLPPVQPVLTSQQSTPCCGDSSRKHIAVDARMARHERRAEAGRECRLRLGPMPFSVPATFAVKPDRK